MEITAKQFYKALIDVWHEGEIKMSVRSYSGRSMFGKTCIGIDLDSAGDLFHLALAIGRNCEMNDMHDVQFPTPLSDNMGLGTIIYFPSLEWESTFTDLDE